LADFARPNWRAAAFIRVGFALTTLGGLLLGFHGLMKAHGHRASLGDLVYWDLQLFALESDGVQGVPLNPELQVARFLVPMATVYAIAEVAAYIFAGRIRGWQVRRTWGGHVIVCGRSAQATLLTERLLAAGERVVSVSGTEQARPTRGNFLLPGDPQSPTTLRGAAVGRAKTVYAFSDDTAINLGIAMAAQAAPRRDGSPITSYVWVADPELCHALRARRLGLERIDGARADFVSPAELAAKVLVAERAATRLRHVMIVGLGAFGRSLLLELTRQQRLLPGSDPAHLTVVDAQASRSLSAMLAGHPLLAHWTVRTVDIEADRFDLAAWVGRMPADDLPDQTYLCNASPVGALRNALTAVPLWHGWPHSLVVCLDHSLTYGELFHTGGAALLDELGGVLKIFGVTDAACRSDLGGCDVVEQLARSIHERYVAAQRRSGRTGSTLVPWHDLPETYRRSNQAQAAHIGVKLRTLGLLAAPNSTAYRPFSFTGEQVEELARLEHRRWCDERRQAGWRYGPDRDEAARKHPSMTDWSLLSETERQKDRDFVLALPDLLADVGLRLVAAARRPAAQPLEKEPSSQGKAAAMQNGKPVNTAGASLPYRLWAPGGLYDEAAITCGTTNVRIGKI
jgi:voltage-gated potassium channel Kch